ncbi:MAG TPA: Xaa-Pro aminopeptidase [Patescibacteria group bacterium]|nr:Xaa-Pro aminopeptidase [Patescibacteria group bacterium]
MIDSNFFQTNRAKLAEKLGGALVVVTGYTRLQRSNDTAHGFEQEANFWYLTGIEEPDWKLVYDGISHKSWLVMPDVDAIHRVFDGSLSPEDAKLRSGVDEVIAQDDLLGLYRRLQRTHSIVYTVTQPSHSEHFNFALNPALHENTKQLERNFAKVQIANKDLAKLRAIKQPVEIVEIQAAIKQTAKAFEAVQQSIDSYRYEYEIEADFTQAFRRSGTMGHAYEPIVAAGANACTLHYVKNASPIKQRQLVLLDVGARVNGYAADISRTICKGEPTKRQRAIFDALKDAQQAIIQLLEPGMPVETYQQSVNTIMFDTLSSLGLAKTSQDETVSTYMPHAVSHGLGIDVHDSLGAPRHLQEGMVLTVEPGIYIPEESIGIRLEDDILITKTGHKNLSASLSTQL